ncbi:T9SS type A sorting domain-containing protein [Flaviramulus sp. BrNp1-15]|uniref:LamG-like jellyroll fold domain-containing protein n=1 Tax=Flaviramulus sp. BrNp1-15 TaxID=2916754 RepID=UPI001EE91A01|nr:LamG-like jellyroll fold domain-containing protein [Flaviramulus sp. BrNp1-15]ULC60438.1 T9SS type A sorting domain-containing protein [Flaviramulus sp. BrNp1-15]
MRRFLPLNFFQTNTFIFFLLFFSIGNAQIIQVEIIGDAVVTQGSTITINAGSSLDFRITNVETAACSNSNRLEIENVTVADVTNFNVSPNNVKRKIKQDTCPGNGNKDLDFSIENTSGNCATVSTLVTIEIKNQANFTFTLEVNSSPVISVLGGSPSADILNGSTTISSVNGTYFGVVEEAGVVTRNYIISNTGSCPLDISAISSSLSDFTVTPYVILSDFVTPAFYTVSIAPGDFVVFPVTFIGPLAGSGTLTSTISISNSDNTTFTFDVSAEMFDFNIPGPGGVTADFRLWLKSTRGITETGSKVSLWSDLGSNGKDAEQPVASNQPTYLDNATDNINFNPVIKFENDGASVEQYLYNSSNGFYSQDVFIVMIPDVSINSSSTRSTVFSGISSGSASDITGIGFGDYSSEFTNETLSYNQDVSGGGSFNGEAVIGGSYSNAGIINVRNNAFVSPTGQDILYNSNVLTTTSVNDVAFVNVGTPGPPIVLGTEYWIGRNFDIQGSLNGRVAEIFTFAERVPDAARQKIESYLAIKYGITLGATNEAQKDYINSFGTKVWDVAVNTGYNYHVAGIGKDSISDLNQKQSKTLNDTNEVAIGLNGVFTTNSANTNEFVNDGDFLVWGSNNLAITSGGSNTVTIDTGLTSSVTRILRQWKIIESTEVTSDVENVYVSIPSNAFSSFTLNTDEEYVLIVADNDNFTDADIIDVVPLKSDGSGNLQTWYDFNGTKYFTFGKASKLSDNHSIHIEAGDYLVGEYALNLNINAFSISAWVKADASQTSTRTVMAKGSKLQLRLNSSHQVEIMLDDDVTPRFISNMVLNDNKWHQISFVYKSGTIYLYVDGVLDKSEHDVNPPSPNFNRFSVGALFVDKNNISNYFLGEIDEVYVWDQELTQAQVRYLMNQEIERFDVSGTDYVNGKILPQASLSNEVNSIPWSNLKAYYDFNSFYGSTVEGLTNNRNFLRLKYLIKDKTIIDNQTIPVPYISASGGDWDAASTWSNSADQIIPNALSLDGSTIIDWNIVQISHDIDSGDRDISLLGLIQTDGILKISDPVDVQDETNSGQGLTITHYLELDGVIDLVGESQLVQTEGSIIDIDSGGYIERDQQGTASGFNYNYWSSSVGPITGNSATKGTGIASTNANHTISGVLNDGTISSSYQSLLYNASPNGSGSIPPPGFARTISTEWLYKFYGVADDYYAWSKIGESSSLLPGEGFTMKGTGGSALIPISTQQNYVFVGLPNNGDITLELDKSSGEVERLIGNPYPSAIDATEFILDNMSIADGGNNSTGTIFNGALYFWDHFGQEDSHVLKDYVGGYATRNLTGGAVAISNDARLNNDLTTGTKVPGQYIPVNQGFFVSTVLDGFDNDNGTPVLTVDGGDIVFKNSQRVYVAEDGAASLFFKSVSSKKKNNSNANYIDVTPTIKLMYSSPLGYHRQIVLGANKNASMEFDLGYDAFMADVAEEDMYWNINSKKFVIQGVDTFDASQEFSLGIKVKEAGIASIKLDALENIDTSTSVFIKDSITEETYKINDSAFDVFLEPGEYNDRYKLVFQQNNMSLSVEESIIANKVLFYYDLGSSELKIINKDGLYISSVNLYNILGQEILSTNLKSTSLNESVELNVVTGIYIVKLETEKGLINKKIVIE